MQAFSFSGNRRARRGFTLIEMVVVMGVFALIVGAIWVVAGVVRENAKQYTFTTQMQQMVQNIRQLYQRINRFQTADVDLTATLDAQEAFPREMRVNPAVAGGTLNHPWSTAGGAVTVLTRNLSSGAIGFGIAFADMPQRACINMIVKLSGGEIAGLDSVLVGGTALATLPVSTVAASAACSSATANDVEWQYELRAN